MIRELYARCAAWATRFRDNLYEDQFLLARLRITLLFFVVAVFITIVIGDAADANINNSVREMFLSQSGISVERSIADIQHKLWLFRGIKLLLIVVSSYFLAVYALRPIKKSAETQKRFIATVSHQLRTPLAVMKNTSEIALRNPDLPLERARNILISNVEESDRLAETIKFLMSFSDFERGDNTLDLQNIILCDLVREEFEKYRGVARSAGITLDFDDRFSGSILGNAVALRHLMTNLIKNALAYTPRGGRVTLAVEQNDQGHVVFSVIDTGRGISAREMNRIWKPFYRGASTAANTDGMGLGLSIVQEIARLHGASIVVESSEGIGSAFRVTFGLK